MPAIRLAYLHGFASSPLSSKARALAPHFASRGVPLHAPDLNRPSFAKLSHVAMLAAVDDLDASTDPTDAPWCLIGSSLGGWLAAQWAALHPDKVHRLLLLCPGFHLAQRWPSLFGEEALAAWERDGSLELPDATGTPTPVHWGFMDEARRVDPAPSVPCPTVIVHGLGDDTVPIASSRRYAAAHPSVTLVEVDDDHSLGASIAVIAAEADRLFGLA